MIRQYPALIHKDAASDYGVSFPDFPGCISSGATVEEAFDMGRDALETHIEAMTDAGEDIPAPTAIGDLPAADLADAALTTLIAARLPAKSVRVNVTIDQNLLADIDAVAANRSAFLAAAATQYLRSREQAA